jgi:Golgi phosphoprotein 3 (GPP34)
VSPGLEGTGRITDDLWLLAHDDVSGRPYIQPRPLGLGLAAGLLAELSLTGAVSIRHDGITAMPVGHQTGVLLSQVLHQVAGESEAHPLADWLAYLARTAATDVAQRLVGSGYLFYRKGLLPWHGGRWIPVDRDSAFAPVLRARAVVDAAQPLTADGVLLAGLADACGLGFRLAQYTPARALRPLPEAIAQLSPSLQDLVNRTKAAVDSAVLAHRA